MSAKILYVYGKKHMKKLKAVTAIPSIETQFVLLAVYDNLSLEYSAILVFLQSGNYHLPLVSFFVVEQHKF